MTTSLTNTYRPSGRTESPPHLFAAAILAVATAGGLGGYVTHYYDILLFSSFALGALTGFFVHHGAWLAHCRNPRLVAVVALLSGFGTHTLKQFVDYRMTRNAGALTFSRRSLHRV